MARQTIDDAVLDRIFEEEFGNRIYGKENLELEQNPVNIGIPESGRMVENLLEEDPEDMG